MALKINIRNESTQYLPSAGLLEVGSCTMYEEGPTLLLTVRPAPRGPRLIEAALTRAEVRELRGRCDRWLANENNEEFDEDLAAVEAQISMDEAQLEENEIEAHERAVIRAIECGDHAFD